MLVPELRQDKNWHDVNSAKVAAAIFPWSAFGSVNVPIGLTYFHERFLVLEPCGVPCPARKLQAVISKNSIRARGEENILPIAQLRPLHACPRQRQVYQVYVWRSFRHMC